MYLLGSLGTFFLGLLLLYNSWLPLVVCLPFAASTTSFLFGVMEASSLQNKLDGVFTSTGQKLVVQLTGAAACFALTAGFAYWALDRDLRQKEIELGINKTKNDPTYIYLVPKNPINKDGDNWMIAVGKLNFSDELEAIKGNEKNKEGNVLNPILVKIRNDCNYGLGLCSISDSIFRVHINNIGNLKSTKSKAVNNVNICRGHNYLEKKTLLISSDPNLIESFKKNQSKNFPDKTYKVYINDESNPSICPGNNLAPPSPILLFGNEKTKTPIPISQFSKYYAIDLGKE